MARAHEEDMDTNSDIGCEEAPMNFFEELKTRETFFRRTHVDPGLSMFFDWAMRHPTEINVWPPYREFEYSQHGSSISEIQTLTEKILLSVRTEIDLWVKKARSTAPVEAVRKLWEGKKIQVLKLQNGVHTLCDNDTPVSTIRDSIHGLIGNLVEQYRGGSVDMTPRSIGWSFLQAKFPDSAPLPKFHDRLPPMFHENAVFGEMSDRMTRTPLHSCGTGPGDFTMPHWDPLGERETIVQVVGKKLWLTWASTYENQLECHRRYLQEELMTLEWALNCLDRKTMKVFVMTPGDWITMEVGLIHACLALTPSMHVWTKFIWLKDFDAIGRWIEEWDRAREHALSEASSVPGSGSLLPATLVELTSEEREKVPLLPEIFQRGLDVYDRLLSEHRKASNSDMEAGDRQELVGWLSHFGDWVRSELRKAGL